MNWLVKKVKENYKVIRNYQGKLCYIIDLVFCQVKQNKYEKLKIDFFNKCFYNIFRK